MKNLLFVIVTFFASLLLTACSNDKVYICTGPQSHAYHVNKDCEGLDRCSREIKAVTLEEAERMHRHPCRFCSKK